MPRWRSRLSVQEPLFCCSFFFYPFPGNLSPICLPTGLRDWDCVCVPRRAFPGGLVPASHGTWSISQRAELWLERGRIVPFLACSKPTAKNRPSVAPANRVPPPSRAVALICRPAVSDLSLLLLLSPSAPLPRPPRRWCRSFIRRPSFSPTSRFSTRNYYPSDTTSNSSAPSAAAASAAIHRRRLSSSVVVVVSSSRRLSAQSESPARPPPIHSFVRPPSTSANETLSRPSHSIQRCHRRPLVVQSLFFPFLSLTLLYFMIYSSSSSSIDDGKK